MMFREVDVCVCVVKYVWGGRYVCGQKKFGRYICVWSNLSELVDVCVFKYVWVDKCACGQICLGRYM